MKFSWLKIAGFFSLMMLVGYLLYPSQYFLGQMNIKNPDRNIPVRFFKNYLKDNPTHKGAVQALVKTYASIGEPEKGIPLLRDLYSHRSGDPTIGYALLQLYADAGLLDEAQAFRKTMVKDNRNNKAFPKSQLEALLYQIYLHAALNQNHETAVEALEELASISDKPRGYTSTAIRYYLASDNMEAVVQKTQKRLRLNPQKIFPWLILSTAYHKQGQTKTALATLDEAIKTIPNGQDLYELRATIHESEGNYNEAAQDVEALIALNPESSDYPVRKAVLLLKANRPDEAVALYRERALNSPTNQQAWLELFYVYKELDRQEEAQDWILKTVKQFPNNKKNVDLLTGLFEEQGRIEDATPYLKEAWDHSPGTLNQGLTLGTLLADTGKFEESVKIYNQLRKRAPHQKQAWWNLIYGYADRDKTEEAAVVLEEYIDLFPNDPEAHELLANMYERQQNIPAKLALLEDYTQKNPDDAKFAKIITDAYIDVQEYEKAEAVVSHWKEKEPDNPLWTLKLGQIKSLQRKPKEAITYFNELLESNGEDPEILKLIGAESMAMGNYPLADEILTKADGLKTNDPDILYLLTETKFATNNRSQGKALAKKALQAIPDDGSLENVRKRLRMEAHLGWNEELENQYLTAIVLFEKNQDLYTDLIDAYLDHGYPEKAQGIVNLFREKFPERNTTWERYDIRIAQMNKDWDKVIELSRRHLESNPDDFYIQRALGEAYYRKDDLKSAELALSKLPLEPDDPYGIEYLLEEIVEKIHHHVGVKGNYYQLPGQKLLEFGAEARGRVNKKLRYEVEGQHGRYRADNRNFDDTVVSGNGVITYLLSKKWKAALMLGGASGGPISTVTPGLRLRYTVKDTVAFEARHQYQRFWNEFPEAVAAGGLADETSVSAEINPTDRLYTRLQYTYNAYQTGDGKTASRNEISPSVSYALLSKPFIAAGYQFLYDKVSGENAFLTQIPLISRARTHYATLTYSQWVLKKVLLVNAYIYNGHDSPRDKRFFEGDLFGVALNANWKPLDRLHLIPGYEFGRDSASGITGKSHTVTLKMEAHWSNHAKTNMSDR